MYAVRPFTFLTAGNRTPVLTVTDALDTAVAAEIAVAARQDRPTVLFAPHVARSLYATAPTAAVGPNSVTPRQPLLL